VLGHQPKDQLLQRLPIERTQARTVHRACTLRQQRSPALRSARRDWAVFRHTAAGPLNAYDRRNERISLTAEGRTLVEAIINTEIG